MPVVFTPMTNVPSACGLRASTACQRCSSSICGVVLAVIVFHLHDHDKSRRAYVLSEACAQCPRTARRVLCCSATHQPGDDAMVTKQTTDIQTLARRLAEFVRDDPAVH